MLKQQRLEMLAHGVEIGAPAQYALEARPILEIYTMHSCRSESTPLPAAARPYAHVSAPPLNRGAATLPLWSPLGPAQELVTRHAAAAVPFLPEQKCDCLCPSELTTD